MSSPDIKGVGKASSAELNVPGSVKDEAKNIPLPPSLSLISTVGSVMTVYHREKCDLRDETDHVDVDMDSMREGADNMSELQRCESSMSVLTEKPAEINNNWYPISRSTSNTSSKWHSATSLSDTSSFGTCNTSSKWHAASTCSKMSSIPTTSLSVSDTSSFGNSFSFWPITMSLSYSNSMFSASNGESEATVVDDDHVEQEGWIKVVKDVAIVKNVSKLVKDVASEVKGFKDDIASIGHDIQAFYNSPRKSVTFTHCCRPPALALDKATEEKDFKKQENHESQLLDITRGKIVGGSRHFFGLIGGHRKDD